MLNYSVAELRKYKISFIILATLLASKVVLLNSDRLANS